MNKNIVISSIAKWPFTIVILRVLAAVALSLIIALIYFSPKNTDLEEQIKNTKQSLSVIDQQLKQRHTYIKTLKRHEALNEVSNQINAVNAINRNFLRTILDINNTKNRFVSIQSLENRSLSIKLHINDWNRFYAFAEAIEKMPITDRIIIHRKTNNSAELILQTSRFSGENQ